MMIPFPVAEGVYSVFVILEPENLQRMKDNDPAQLNVWKLPEEYRRLTLRDVIIATPSAEDTAKAMNLIRQGDPGQAFLLLSRGFQYKPKEGDNDLPYQPSRQQ
jgi:hypothetical protein